MRRKRVGELGIERRGAWRLAHGRHFAVMIRMDHETTSKRPRAARVGYIKNLAGLVRPHEKFDAALRLLVPDGDHKSILALLDNRVTWSAVKHWRKGRNAIPEWVNARIAQEIEPLEKLCADIKKMPAPLGRDAGLKRWRAARFG